MVFTEMLASLVLQLMFISSVTSADVKCMTKNVYFEANNQSELGKEAIVHVVLNRVEDTKFPNTPCEVIHQAKRDRNGNPIRNKCQFSWYCDGKSDKINDPSGYDKARIAVITALLRRAYNGHLNSIMQLMSNHTGLKSLNKWLTLGRERPSLSNEEQ